jgi:aryl-alcohol dehydrogenase-like predicted oxidoreductase
MRYRLLGQTGLRVSELFLGAMIWTPEGEGGVPPQEGRVRDLYTDGRPQRRRQPPQEPHAVTGAEPAAAAHRRH